MSWFGIVHYQFWMGSSISLMVAFLVINMSNFQQSDKLGYKNVCVHPTSKRNEHAHDDTDEDLHEQCRKPVDKQPVGAVKFEDTHSHHDDDSLAKYLYTKERVLCWIMTSPQNLQKRARAVRDTWSKRCNVVVFMSSETDPEFPTVGLDVSEGREHLTAKTVQAFRYVYEKHFNDADWFMKADDDTYVILENLRYFLTSYSTKEPVYFGHHFNSLLKQGFYSGGAGYVLSKEALRRFYEKGMDPSICLQDGGAEDFVFGKCMENLGVMTADSTDSLGRSRFHCFNLETHLFGEYPDWYYDYDANGAKKGADSISDYAISFHYVQPQTMYSLDFYIYHLKLYGIVSGKQHQT